MILLLRALARLVAFVLLAGLAACGAAVAIFSVGPSRTGDFSLPGLARLADLGGLRRRVGELLSDLAGPGPVAAIAVLCGLGALALGLLLLLGALWPPRERLVILERGEQGTLAARRRALGRAAGALAEQAQGVTASKVRVRPGRRRGGRLAVRATHSRAQAPEDVRRGAILALAPLTGAFGLHARVQARLGQHRGRVR
jgi:hypothetical protein